MIVEGKHTTVYTKFSHGGGDPGKDLLSKVKKDLNFQSRMEGGILMDYLEVSKVKKDLNFQSQEDFESFIDCFKTYEEYVSELRNEGII